MFSLPGIAPASGAPAAPGTAPAVGRSAVPQSPGSGPSVRTSSPVVLNPAYSLVSVTDIEFDAAGQAYVSDPVNGVVDIFNESGPVTGWANLPGVDALAELNGVMYGMLPFEGSMVRFNPTGRDVERVARNITLPRGLLAANGRLWTTNYWGSYQSFMTSFDPATGGRWTQPAVYSTGISWDYPIPERTVDSLIISQYRGFHVQALSNNPLPNAVSLPIAVAPNGAYFVDSEGRRSAAGSLLPDGFVYPGTGHSISGPLAGRPALVAALRDGVIRVYDETNPGQTVYSLFPGSGVVFSRFEFRPGTSKLWFAYQAGSQILVSFRDIPALAASAALFTDSALSEETVEAPKSDAVLSPPPPPPPPSTPSAEALVPVPLIADAEHQPEATVGTPVTITPATVTPVANTPAATNPTAPTDVTVPTVTRSRLPVVVAGRITIPRPSLPTAPSGKRPPRPKLARGVRTS